MSKTIYQDGQIKAVVFGFGQGQELSEHTAAKSAMLYFVKGEASVGLGVVELAVVGGIGATGLFARRAGGARPSLASRRE